MGTRPSVLTETDSTILIVFTGIDGAGKTTQAKLLEEALIENGVDARYEHLTGPNSRLTKVIKERIGELFLDKEDELMLSESTDTEKKRFNPVGLFFIYRGMWQSWYTVITNYRAEVLILDRYLYDDLARVNWKYGYDTSYLARIGRLAPPPDLVVHLDAKPSVAWEREVDGRTTIEQHREKRECVNDISRNVLKKSTMVHIDTSRQSVETTHQKILMRCRDL